MAGIDPCDLFDQASELLEASISALDTIPGSCPGLLGAPDRAFVSSGTPALDCCDQLTVNVIPIREAPTSPLEMGASTRAQQDFRINYVGFNVTITRCADLSDFPPAATALMAVAEQTYADAWALWNYLWNLKREGNLFGGVCFGSYFDNLAPLTPSGGCYGSVLTIRTELQGYEGTS